MFNENIKKRHVSAHNVRFILLLSIKFTIKRDVFDINVSWSLKFNDASYIAFFDFYNSRALNEPRSQVQRPIWSNICIFLRTRTCNELIHNEFFIACFDYSFPPSDFWKSLISSGFFCHPTTFRTTKRTELKAKPTHYYQIKIYSNRVKSLTHTKCSFVSRTISS